MKDIKKIEKELKNSKSECEKAMDGLKNKLEDKTKQHNDLIARQESNLKKKGSTYGL
ncbi:MAG: hypothetical protein WBE22_01985 [Halobacteriota archaeon]